MPLINALIDGFSRSVIDQRTGRSRATVIRPWGDLRAGAFARTLAWEFNWMTETAAADRDVYGLTIRRSHVIEGLLSLETESDHLFLHLLESAPHNRSKAKRFGGVPGNLVAFACLLSLKAGFKGHLAFDSKTVLIKHYETTLERVMHFST